MAVREVNLILDTERRKAQRSFNDATPTSLAEIIGPILKDDQIKFNVFAGKWTGGHFQTTDISGYSGLEMVVRRPWMEPKGGSCTVAVGASSATDVKLPMSADSFQSVLNGLSVVQTDVTTVEVDKEGTSFTVIGKDDADLTSEISISQIDSIPICTDAVSTVQGGGASNREQQVVDIAEAAIATQSSWSDITTPAAAVNTVNNGGFNPEIQDISITGNPESGSIVCSVAGPNSGIIQWDIRADAAAVKNAYNTDTSGLVQRVEKLAEFTWRVVFAGTSAQDETSPTFYGTEYHGITATLDLNTSEAASIFAAYGSDPLEAELTFRADDGSNTDTLFRETVIIDKGVIDSSTSSALSAPYAVYTEVHTVSTALAASECWGGVHYGNGSITLTLPQVQAGMSVSVPTIGTNTISIDPDDADTIILDGSSLNAGDKITNSGTSGDLAVLTYYGANTWYAATNEWTDGG